MQTTNTTKLPETAEERVLFTLRSYELTIHYAVAKTHGLSAWFKAYTQSEDFAKLSNENKAEAFDKYADLKYVLNSIEREGAELENNYTTKL